MRLDTCECAARVPAHVGATPFITILVISCALNFPLDILLVQYTAILPCGSPDYLRSLLVMRSYLCMSIPPMFLFQKCFCIRLDQSSNEKSRLYTMK